MTLRCTTEFMGVKERYTLIRAFRLSTSLFAVPGSHLITSTVDTLTLPCIIDRPTGALTMQPETLNTAANEVQAEHAHPHAHPHDHTHTHTHSHDHDHAHSHHHDHHHDHGHTHEIMEHAGKFVERDMPVFHSRDWSERAFTIGIGG